ncbi:hypothetical protein BIV23_03235 [Streptomyces monashensis]|uniref:Uncharacterized protein n=1 Tax=Streptomyces monashensis TaxID=1678012 RepID=A0A1S2QPI2_9ACTN|nr:hypothetical protein BIV23_03235 [Streptomyces monashensis]
MDLAVRPEPDEFAVRGAGVSVRARRETRATPLPAPTSPWATSYDSVSKRTLGLKTASPAARSSCSRAE